MCRVIVVDDDPCCVEAMVDIAKDALGEDGTVEGYTDPMEFIDAAKCGKKPNLLLVDYVMPSMDGLRAIRILRGYGVDCQALIVSGFPFEVSHRLLPTNNVSLVVAKPFQTRELSHLIRRSILGACDFSFKGVVA